MSKITAVDTAAIVANIKPPPATSNRTRLNIQGPCAVARGPAIITTVSVLDAGSSGFLVLNDADSIDHAKGSNVLESIPCARLKRLGPLFEIYRSVARGVVISRVPRGARVVLSYRVAEETIMSGSGAVN
jgi:hypothetical protein